MADLVPAIPNDTCDRVGQALPDIAGVGVIISFAGQGLLSLIIVTWVFFLSEIGRLDVRHNEGTEEYKIQIRRLTTFSKLLMVGNDFQMLLGIAYMITSWTKQAQIGLYHLRLVFDTVSFVGISGTVALVSNTYLHGLLGKPVSRRSPRYLTTYLFAMFFTALTLVVLVRLRNWDGNSETPGLCYVTNGVSLAISDHPLSDIIYVAITASWLLGAMALASFAGPRRRRILLLSAYVQYPVHLYFAISIRHVNQPQLEGDEREDGWDFGQTTAMLLLGVAILEVASKTLQYRRERSELDLEIEQREYEKSWGRVVITNPIGVR